MTHHRPITCNGTPTSSTASCLADLVAERLGDPPPDGIAVALDGEVVPRSAWATTPLGRDAVVDVVTAVQGG